MRIKPRRINVVIVLLFLALVAYVVAFHVVLNSWQRGTQEAAKTAAIHLDNVLVHLDLKGAPPKLKYLETLLPVFKENGATGILIEYEDMFPYRKFVNLSARNCYKEKELKSFLSKATSAGLEIIPLIQTFGHMESVLKLQQFQHLRESTLFPDSICPSQEESIQVIGEMLREVIDFHKSVTPLKHIHIGCDEVFHINECQLCSQQKLDVKDIFIRHVNKIASMVQQIAPNTTVLMWDDMLRTIRVPQWTSVTLSRRVEPVCWDYRPTAAFSHVHLLMYHAKFTNIWIATAYKGADGKVSTIPHYKNRFDNHVSWLNFIRSYKFAGEHNVYNFKGIILTGWSRYSHMDPLCDLLPASLPALLVNLILIKFVRTQEISDGKDIRKSFANYFDKSFLSKLKFDEDFNEDFVDGLAGVFRCSELYTALKMLITIQSQVEDKLTNEDESDSAIEFYSDFNKIKWNNVINDLDWINSVLKDLKVLEKDLRVIMHQYYERDVIDEYLKYKLAPMTVKLVGWRSNILTNYKVRRSWARGPIDSNTTVEHFVL